MDSFEGVKICFLADKHDLFDDRIYWKMAVHLHKLGAEVHYYLIGDTNMGGITEEGIHFRIWKLKTFTNNLYLNHVLKRLNPNNNYDKLFKAAASLKADVYHFHDLWINRIAPKLKALPHRPVVFYDAREPYAEDYRSFYGSDGFSKGLVGAFSKWVDKWEKKKARNYDLVIANEPIVRDGFVRVIGDEKAEVLYNFVDLETMGKWKESYEIPQEKKWIYDLIYCGMLTEKRGAFSILKAARKVREKQPGIRILLLGRIDPPSLRSEMLKYVAEHGLEELVEFKEQVPYKQVVEYYRQSRIGLILWKPEDNLKIKMPIKLFEYMAFGLPVIGSDFGHIREYIDRHGCGITVDPENAGEVAKAIDALLREDRTFEIMSRKGVEATLNEYSWKNEFDRLRGFYQNALNERTARI